MPNATQPLDFTLKGRGLFFLAALGIPFALFGFFWACFIGAIAVGHWLAWVVAAVALACSLGVLASVHDPKDAWLRDFLPVHAVTMHFAGSVASGLILVTFSAWISFALIELGVADVTSPAGPVEYGALVRSYLWQMLAMIPGIDPEKSIGMPLPEVQFTGWVAAIPILMFRVGFGLMVLASLQRAWSRFSTALENVGKEPPLPESPAAPAAGN